MERLRHTWHRTPKRIRQTVVLFVGTLVIIAGVIMLAVPGPGWLTIFIGLAILATEFEIAERWKNKAESRVKQAAEAAKSKAKRLRKK